MDNSIYKLYCTQKGKSKLENQDCYMLVDRKDYLLAVVADGLGASKFSSKGAKSICKIISSYVINNFQYGLKYIEKTLNRIPILWENEILSIGNSSDYCTTCSFLLIDKTKNNFIACKVGDSLIIVVSDETNLNIRDSKDFLNETQCIGSQNVKFDIKQGTFNKEIGFVLASDGIGDEIDLTKSSELLDYFRNHYSVPDHAESNRQFKKEIIASFGPLNNDDKTIIIGWNKYEHHR